MSRLPARLDHEDRGWLTTRQAVKARRARDATELAIYRHGLRAAAMAEFDRQDSEAAAAAVQTTIDAEVDVLEYGMNRAGQSVAKINVVARKVELLSSINNRRLARRFGA